MATSNPVIYSYDRRLREDGTWNINNPYDVDDNGYSVTLDTRIMQALPAVVLYSVALDATTAYVEIDELSTDEKALLDQTVAAHEAATGTINQQTSIQLMSQNGTEYDVFVTDDGSVKTNPI